MWAPKDQRERHTCAMEERERVAEMESSTIAAPLPMTGEEVPATERWLRALGCVE